MQCKEQQRKILQCSMVHNTAQQYCAAIWSLDCRVFFPGRLIEPVTQAPPPFSDRSIVNLTINCNLFICDRSSKGPIWSSLCLLFPPLGRPWKKSPAYAAPPHLLPTFLSCRSALEHTTKSKFTGPFTAGKSVCLEYSSDCITEHMFIKFCSIQFPFRSNYSVSLGL